MKFAIYGAGGFGREIFGGIQQMELGSGEYVDNLAWIDDAVSPGTLIHGVPVISLDRAIAESRRIVIAIGDPVTRRDVASRVPEALWHGYVAPGTLGWHGIEIGPGTVICDGARLTADCTLGCHVHVNLMAYVAHDCVVGDFVTLAPRASINGNVQIGDGATIGTGAMIRDGLRIGAGAIVGMGAVVIDDVPAGATVVGNPARILRRAA